MIGLVAWTGQKTATQPDVLGNSTNAIDANNNNGNTTNTVVKPSAVNSINSNVNAERVTTSDYSLLAEAETNVIGEITTYTFAENNRLNVMPATMQAAVLNETPVKQRAAITIGNTAAERLTVTSAKDGSEITVVQAVVGEKLYDFRGSEEFLSNLSQYITFAQ